MSVPVRAKRSARLPCRRPTCFTATDRLKRTRRPSLACVTGQPAKHWRMRRRLEGFHGVLKLTPVEARPAGVHTPVSGVANESGPTIPSWVPTRAGALGAGLDLVSGMPVLYGRACPVNCRQGRSPDARRPAS